MKREKNYAFSLVRIVSIFLILLCHTCEQIGYTLGRSEKLGVFGNYCAVGVQVFLILSGYLYGCRRDIFKTESRIDFLSKNIKKILLDYYVYVFIILLPVYLCLKPGVITIKMVLGILTCSGFVGGGCIIFGIFLIFYVVMC